MNANLCPLCRFSMRLWALSWRRGDALRSNVDEGLLIRTAAGFRDECLHPDREKYDALVAKLSSLPMKSSPLALAIWFEIERIKNLHGGHKPSGRTYLAWRSKYETTDHGPRTTAEPATCNLQPATQQEAA